MTAKNKSKKVTKLKLHKPNPKTKKVMLAEVFTVDGVINYKVNYKNDTEGMALYLYLGKLQKDVLAAMFTPKTAAPIEKG